MNGYISGKNFQLNEKVNNIREFSKNKLIFFFLAFDRTCFSSPQNSASCSVAQGHTNPCVFPSLPLDTKIHGCSTSGVIVEWQYQQVFDLLILRALILARSSSSSGFTKETEFLGTFPSSVLFSRASALTSSFYCCC